jgi:hypothetical protein
VIFYTDLMPARFSGYAIGPIILIRPRCKNDAGLLAHEQVHVSQFWRTLGIGMLLSVFMPSLRLKYEVEAYRKQLEFNPDASLVFAGFISTKYGLSITVTDALKLITE